MKTVAFCGMTLLLACVLTHGGTVALPDRLGVKPAFVALSKQETFTARNLYDYNDGGADAYLEAGATGCVVRSYSQEERKDREFEVAVFTLGSEVQAFGLFRQLQTGESAKVGVESALSPLRLMFWKTGCYAEVVDKSSKPAEPAVLASLGEAVAGLIPGTGAMPRELAVLPGSRKISGSERYWKSGFLSRGFLDNVISAEYRTNNAAPCTLFVMTCPSESLANARLGKLTDEVGGAGGRVHAFASRNRVAGCVGCARGEWEAKMSGMLIENLRR